MHFDRVPESSTRQNLAVRIDVISYVSSKYLFRPAYALSADTRLYFKLNPYSTVYNLPCLIGTRASGRPERRIQFTHTTYGGPGTTAVRPARSLAGDTSRNTAPQVSRGRKKEHEEGRNADPIIILGEPRPVQAAYL